MKELLIKLNRPLLINNSKTYTPNYQTVYGFFAPYYDKAEERNKNVKDHISEYLCYLATIHEWDNNSCVKDFFLVKTGGVLHWIDKKGKEHTWDGWTHEIGKKSRERLGIDYTSYLIDLQNATGECLTCGIADGRICCKTLMDTLVTIAENQEREGTTAIVFNHPIWLPKEVLWPEEKGFCSIYGVTISGRQDDSLLDGLDSYLGYLAMCEEYCLNGKTPSGFTAGPNEDLSVWMNGDTKYCCYDIEVVQECLLCKEKHNLNAVATPLKRNISDGVKDSFIVSLDTYESILRDIDNSKD